MFDVRWTLIMKYYSFMNVNWKENVNNKTAYFTLVTALFCLVLQPGCNTTNYIRKNCFLAMDVS